MELKKRISNILREIGVPAHLLGYEYLQAAITIAVGNRSAIYSITKSLYPTVADLFGTTVSGVERAIRSAIEVAWDRGDLDVLESYFGNTVCSHKGKPTNGEFIATIADTIRLEETD